MVPYAALFGSSAKELNKKELIISNTKTEVIANI